MGTLIFYCCLNPKGHDTRKRNGLKKIGSPLVSVVIPTFNRSQPLARALNSLERQSFKSFEVVVVDDGSSDDTEQVAKNFQSRLCLRFLKISPSGGPARPRNTGVSQSRGTYVAFLDSDDFWHEDKLAHSVGAMTNGAVFSYHDGFKTMEGANRPFRKIRARALSGSPFQDLLTGGNPILTSSVVVGRDVFELAGGFDEAESLRAIEDFDLWLRIARLSSSFHHIPHALCTISISPDSISAPPLRLVTNLNALYRKWEKDFVNLGLDTAPLWVADSLYSKTVRAESSKLSSDEGELVFDLAPLGFFRKLRLRAGGLYHRFLVDERRARAAISLLGRRFRAVFEVTEN